MKSPKVIGMVQYSGNTRHVSRQQALEAFRDYLQRNPDIDKVFLMALDTKNDSFHPMWFRAQMLNSEVLAALDIVHSEITDLLLR